jgi:hypothetical protein
MSIQCFIPYGVCIVSWTQTFKAIVHTSRKHQSAQEVWIFHQVVSNLVLRIVSVKHRVYRIFEAFNNPDHDLARFVELMSFL